MRDCEFENGKTVNNSLDFVKRHQIPDVDTTFEINDFVRVRENYFNYLKKVINDNCNKCCNASVSENDLEKMSLNLEQPILLACLKIETYQLLMRDIIFKIKKLTGQGMLHLELKMMIEKILSKTPSHLGTDVFDYRQSESLMDKDLLPGKSPRSSQVNGQKISYQMITKSSVEQELLNSKTDKDDCVRADIINILENYDGSRSSVNEIGSKCYKKMTSDKPLYATCDGSKFLKGKTKQSLWKHEKVIQMHHLSLLLSQKTEEERMKSELVFLDLFGVDGDVNNAGGDQGEQSHQDEEMTYKRSCSERISALVVRHLMPFYRENQIVGRTVFKKLGYFISGKIFQETEYPEEQYVKYYVAKFFRDRRVYADETDVH